MALRIPFRKFLLFDASTIPHNQRIAYPPMERDNIKWWLWNQLTVINLSRLSESARVWLIGKEYESIKESLIVPARLHFILKTMEESFEHKSIQNGNVLEVLCMNMDEVWSILKCFYKSVWQAPLIYDKDVSHSRRKCFEKLKKKKRFENIPKKKGIF